MLAEITSFVNWLRRRNPSARTWRDYGYDLRQFAALTGDCAPGSVTFHDVDRFVTQQAAKGYQPGTVNRRLAALQSFYTFLADDDPTLVCPVLPHRHSLRDREHLPRPVPDADLDQFFAVIADTRDRAMFLLMLRCGLRIAEVAELRLADLYLDERCPRLVARGKGARERSVYLSPQAEQALRAYLAARPARPSDSVFLSYLGDGLSTTAIHQRLMGYRAQAGVSLTAHRLRHSFANDLLSADVPVTTLQKLLGHRWLETTQVYVLANDYLTDRFMHVMGLHGRSFLPLFLGFGCNVPAVMATRTIDSPKARLLSIVLAPFVPCPARMTVIAVLAPIFFGAYAPLVAMGLVVLSMVVLAAVGVGLHELVLGGEHLAFVMELPLYHAPDWRAILRSMWQRILDFLQVAGSTILIVSVLLWALSDLPTGHIESSYLAQAGRLLEPIGRVMGWGWQMMVALLTSFVRKENVIATLGVLYGSSHAGTSLGQALRATLAPASALSFLVVQMLFIPCVATLATIWRETRSWRWTLGSVALLLAISFGSGVLVFYAARWLGW